MVTERELKEEIEGLEDELSRIDEDLGEIQRRRVEEGMPAAAPPTAAPARPGVPAAAPPAYPAGPPPGYPAYKLPKPKAPKKPKVPAGAGKILAVIIAFFVSLAASFFIFFPFSLIAVVIVFFFISIILFPRSRKYMIGIFIILVIVWLIWLIYFTTGGSIVSAKAGKGQASVFNGLREAAAPLSTAKCILTGACDPSQIWSSEYYQDKYAAITDVGVRLEDLRSLRPVFFSDAPVTVVGKVRAASLPDAQTSVSISAAGHETETDLAFKSPANWKCDPSIITGTRLYLGQFYCTYPHPGRKGISPLFVEPGLTRSHIVDVTIEYDFTTVAGKQVHVANYQELGTLYVQGKDPMKFYGISKAEIESWQTEGPVSLGLGLSSGEAIIGANYLVSQEDKNNIPNFLGVTLRNTGRGEVVQTSEATLTLTLPCSIESVVDDENDFEFDSRNTDFGVPLCTYKVKKGGLRSYFPKTIKQGDYVTLYFKFRAWDDSPGLRADQYKNFLRGSPISNFFVRTDLSYTYQESKSIGIEVKGIS